MDDSTTQHPIRITDVVCSGCNQLLHLQVCHSAAGFYLGHFCGTCGPHDRMSHYFNNKSEVETILAAILSNGVASLN